MKEDDHFKLPGLSPGARLIIDKMINRMRLTADISELLSHTLKSFLEYSGAERAVVWQIVGDNLRVTQEASSSADAPCLLGKSLSPMDSTELVLRFLTLFPDEDSTGVAVIADVDDDTANNITSRALDTLYAESGVKARLVGQLRSRGMFLGFLELQTAGDTGFLEADCADTMKSVCDLLAVMIERHNELRRLREEYSFANLTLKVIDIFRAKKKAASMDMRVAMEKCCKAITSESAYQNYIFYRLSENALSAVLKSGSGTGSASTSALFDLDLGEKDHPVTAAYFNRTISARDSTLYIPLVSKTGDYPGILVLLDRDETKTFYSPEEAEGFAELSSHLAAELSDFI
ncbi:MAG: GAF domain-containing protein [Candidatus Obscuribacterales bacterium]|nr:GAF domain-containing protein [Cyanobacteria bacterium HKST-UBA01]MCB9467473.1 GAF domain-containing protein [Candidatus Obscuribacterales bacterium]